MSERGPKTGVSLGVLGKEAGRSGGGRELAWSSGVPGRWAVSLCALCPWRLAVATSIRDGCLSQRPPAVLKYKLARALCPVPCAPPHSTGPQLLFQSSWDQNVFWILEYFGLLKGTMVHIPHFTLISPAGSGAAPYNQILCSKMLDFSH